MLFYSDGKSNAYFFAFGKAVPVSQGALPAELAAQHSFGLSIMIEADNHVEKASKGLQGNLKC